MALFGRAILPNILSQKTPSFHHDIYRLLSNSHVHRRGVIAPRGHAKSVIGSVVYPLWKILFKPPEETRYILIGSETQDQAIKFLNTIKLELESNPRIHYYFGNLVGDKWTQDEITTRNRVCIKAIGSGQRIRGTNFLSQRPTDVILDDIESENNTNTPEFRRKIQDWVAGAVEPSMDPLGYLSVLGTIVHQDAYLAMIQEDPTFEVLFYQAIMGDKALWPERYSVERLNGILASYRAKGQAHMFYQEYMNQPRNPEEQAFRKEDVKYWDGEIYHKNGYPILRLKLGDKFVEKPVNVYVGVDLAISSRGDFNVLLPVAIDSDENFYVGDYQRIRAEPYAIVDNMFQMADAVAPLLFIIETTAYQQSIVSWLRREMQNRRRFLGVREVKPRDSKNVRLMGLEPLFKAGKVFIKPRHSELESELLAFPKGRTDDILDALWNAIQFASRATRSGGDESLWSAPYKAESWRTL